MKKKYKVQNLFQDSLLSGIGTDVTTNFNSPTWFAGKPTLDKKIPVKNY